MESTLRWADLRNPIYSRDQCSVRDACVVRVPDGIALFYSLFSIDHGRVRSRVEGVMTTDFLHYSEPLWQWDGPDYGWIGMCSPRIIQADGRWILTMNSCGDMPGRPDRLYFSESIDGHSWSLLQPLADTYDREKPCLRLLLWHIDHNGCTHKNRNLIWAKLHKVF